MLMTCEKYIVKVYGVLVQVLIVNRKPPFFTDFRPPKCKFHGGHPVQNGYKNAGPCILPSSPLRSVVSGDKLEDRLDLMVHRD